MCLHDVSMATALLLVLTRVAWCLCAWLQVMGNVSEFQRAYSLVISNPSFDINVNVSVFETNIRGECSRATCDLSFLCLTEHSHLPPPPSHPSPPLLSPVVGGLLSAHLLSVRAGVPLAPGWPCQGPLLAMAESLARKLLAGALLWLTAVGETLVCLQSPFIRRMLVM